MKTKNKGAKKLVSFFLAFALVFASAAAFMGSNRVAQAAPRRAGTGDDDEEWLFLVDDYVSISPLKMRWQSISGEPVTKRIGNAVLTYDSKEYGCFGGVALITVDPTPLPDGKSITISIPQKDINITVGGETLATTVDFEDVTLTNSDGSRQFMVAAITSRSDLTYNDFVGKTIMGNIDVSVEFS